MDLIPKFEPDYSDIRCKASLKLVTGRENKTNSNAHHLPTAEEILAVGQFLLKPNYSTILVPCVV